MQTTGKQNENTMTTPKPLSQRKSSKLSKPERRLLKTYVKSFLTLQEAADNIGIHRMTLARVLRIGRGSPPNINLVRITISEMFD